MVDIATSLLTNDHEDPHPIYAVRGIEEYGRMFGNLIHDIPYKWSGYASIEAIRKKRENKRYKPSADHYNSRQRCGQELVYLILKYTDERKVPPADKVLKIINKSIKVHYVLREQNTNVRPFMAKGMSPGRAYRKAGIRLRKATTVFKQRNKY